MPWRATEVVIWARKAAVPQSMAEVVRTVGDALQALATKIAVAREKRIPDVHGRALAAIDIIPKVQRELDRQKGGVFKTELIHNPDWISVSVLRSKNTAVEVVQLKAADGVVSIQKMTLSASTWYAIPLDYDPIASAFSGGVDQVTLEVVNAIAEWLAVPNSMS